VVHALSILFIEVGNFLQVYLDKNKAGNLKTLLMFNFKNSDLNLIKYKLKIHRENSDVLI